MTAKNKVLAGSKIISNFNIYIYIYSFFLHRANITYHYIHIYIIESN
jgi:hypothetical protein